MSRIAEFPSLVSSSPSSVDPELQQVSLAEDDTEVEETSAINDSSSSESDFNAKKTPEEKCRNIQRWANAILSDSHLPEHFEWQVGEARRLAHFASVEQRADAHEAILLGYDAIAKLRVLGTHGVKGVKAQDLVSKLTSVILSAYRAQDVEPEVLRFVGEVVGCDWRCVMSYCVAIAHAMLRHYFPNDYPVWIMQGRPIYAEVLKRRDSGQCVTNVLRRLHLNLQDFPANSRSESMRRFRNHLVNTLNGGYFLEGYASKA